MLLAIDFGNSRTKCAVFENNTIISNAVFSSEETSENLYKLLKKYPDINEIVVASVTKEEKSIFENLPKSIKIHFVSHQDKFPFTNLYTTPETLGIDRYVLATGAVLNFPNQNRLVIDAGTCITYDFINDKNEYLGGAISPGISLRYKSLNQYTAKLPLLTIKEPENFIGNSTQESIHVGVIDGICNEIDGFINTYKSNNENFIIILTGGDTVFFAKRLKNTIFANSNFVLESLNQFFQYQSKND